MRFNKRGTSLKAEIFDECSFFKAFIKDVRGAKSQIIVESPFITTKRMEIVLPEIQRAIKRGVTVIVNTRNPEEHELEYQMQALDAIFELQEMGVTVLYTARHHRKIAIIDSVYVWHGSLNILSFNDSCEMMWRITSKDVAKQMIDFVKIAAYTKE